jgi:alkanesulfonate monooxygenase SsuD/methylene tetrahydromethanopterin reductase-like flavin-dependent oxidoreductase (luciferase family)
MIMRYGLNMPVGGVCSDARVLAKFAYEAEVAGWDGFFLEDYLVYHAAPGAETCDPWVALAAIALQTKRILIGTDVTPVSRRRPWKLARETVTLDHLSQGRMILGVGLGDTNDAGFSCTGEAMSVKQRAGMLDEALEILIGLWSGEPFHYHGEYYQLDEVQFLPRPLQRPRIPIWVGGSFPLKGPMERAARWDGSFLSHLSEDGKWSPAAVRELKAFVEQRRSFVTSPFEIALGGQERAADWEQEQAYVSSLAQAGATWWIEAIPPSSIAAMLAAIQRGPLRVD